MWDKTILVSSLKVWNGCQTRVKGRETRAQLYPQQHQTVPYNNEDNNLSADMEAVPHATRGWRPCRV